MACLKTRKFPVESQTIIITKNSLEKKCSKTLFRVRERKSAYLLEAFPRATTYPTYKIPVWMPTSKQNIPDSSHFQNNSRKSNFKLKQDISKDRFSNFVFEKRNISQIAYIVFIVGA